MTPENLSKAIVHHYVASYTDGLPDPEDNPTVTMAAVRCTVMDREGFDSLNVLAQALRQACYAYSTLQNNPIRDARAHAAGPAPGYVDIMNLTELLMDEQYPGVPVGYLGAEIYAAASALWESLYNAIVAAEHGPSADGLSSLSIYFPTSGPEPEYLDSRMAADTMWDEFLVEFATPQELGLG
ncbi:MAG TPA: hypothetical protein EYP04_11855, partial [Anaerolineae bacterium]|nr:hypothetical protein [Anaerolineae bacterium]